MRRPEANVIGRDVIDGDVTKQQTRVPRSLLGTHPSNGRLSDGTAMLPGKLGQLVFHGDL